MTVTLTSLKLRSLWGYFRLSWTGLKISLQARKQPGFIKMKNTGFGYLHFTASAWESAEAAKNFAHSGAHLLAMKEAATLASEVRIYSFDTNELPDWKETQNLLEQKGRIYRY